VSLLKDMARTLKVARRPDSKVYRASLRMVVLALSVVGGLGYVFQLAGSALRMARLPAVSSEVLVVVLAAISAISLAVALYLARRYA